MIDHDNDDDDAVDDDDGGGGRVLGLARFPDDVVHWSRSGLMLRRS